MCKAKEKLRDLKAAILPDSIYLKNIFRKHLGYSLNLDEPHSFNEKIQWLKLYYKDPLLTVCADKLAVRDYIRDKLGEEYLIPLIYSTDNPDDLLTFQFPDYPFIIKANHDSGGYQIVRDINLIDRKQLIIDAKKWLANNHSVRTKEWQYQGIKPAILIERLLVDKHGEIPDDIKFSCINGKVEMVHVDSNKKVKHLRNNYFRDFTPCPIYWPAEYERNETLTMPPSFFKARKLAESLAQPFPFVRVDFYFLEDEIYFGELTFHPTSGFGRFYPEYYDYKLGSKLTLPAKLFNK